MTISTELAEKARLRVERECARKAKARSSWASSRNTHHAKNELRYHEYPFVMWDGEAPKDTGYSLFGSSAGHEICAPHLTTEQCFDLLLEAKQDNPQTIFVMFGSRYDFDEIIRQSMPPDRLGRIKWYGSVTWHGYTVKQAEGKWFTIKKDGVTVKVYEIFGWFNTAFVKALEQYQIGTEAERGLIRRMKEERSEFLWKDIEEQKIYMHLENKLGAVLMEYIRSICLQAGFNPRAWYGPSALATQMLRQHGIKKHMAQCPPMVNEAARAAYAAGRFEMFRGGILSPVHSADINNAYVRAMLDLPSLANGKWRRGCSYEPGKFGVYRIRYKHNVRFAHTFPMPLFRRLQNGTVCWPATVDNWYWNPEAELVANDPQAKFLDAWIFDENSPERPFKFVTEVYRKRMVLKSLPESNPSRAAELPFKWALVAIYGQLCRTVGWDQFRRKPPAFHQLEWAGYITSWCRAQVWRVAVTCGDKLISIDTDSVTAMCPIDVLEGNNLGDWKLSEADSGVFYQSGVYFLCRNNAWIYTRLRGIDYRGKKPPVDPQQLVLAIQTGKSVRVISKTRYISIRQSLGWGLKLQGQWVTPKDLETLVFGGQGKRYHNKKRCKTLCHGDMHVFVPVGNLCLVESPITDFERILYWSKPHVLPWLEKRDTDINVLRDWLWADTDNMDKEDYWKLELVE